MPDKEKVRDPYEGWDTKTKVFGLANMKADLNPVDPWDLPPTNFKQGKVKDPSVF